MNMLKKIAVAVLALGSVVQAQAFEKSQVNLANDFWGTWSVYNAKTQCTETYQFSKPGQFNYATRQKKMTGEFAILRSKEPQSLDVLAMKVKTDNKSAGCSNEVVDYTNADVRLSLKWTSAKTAELCIDQLGTQCTGLYLIKQK